ncbi:low-specificity L-threonine aldolase [bacterium]|nr:low-specificity L-threonine aldolase [candidate division CSSED10-310 bacterium]
MIDLRSDTVTQPTQAMRDYMCSAPVGDDVMGEDPSINELEQAAATLLGKEKAVFVPSGTMANQIAVRVYAGPGSEILAVDQSHLFFYEGGSAAGLSGTQIHPVPSINGIFDVGDFAVRIRNPEDEHLPLTKLMWIENTHNRGGGRIVPYKLVSSLYELGKQKHIPLHIDGARIANAAVATGIPLHDWGSVCDSLSLCLSKGLGAPVGSILAGSHEFIRKARRCRKALGGGMRQAGIIAAGGLYALNNNIQRLAEDHRLAKLLAEGLSSISGLSIQKPVETNIVMINLEKNAPFTAPQLQDILKDNGVLAFANNPYRLRAVVHMYISESDIHSAVSIFRKVMTR